MRYLSLLLILSIQLTSCKKDNNSVNNPARAEILGNYHFCTITYGTATDTIRYDAAITAPTPDDGNKVCIPYYNNPGQCELFTTSDSSCTSTDINGSHGIPAYHAFYRHDSIFINQTCYICNYQTIGVKY